MKRSHIIIFVIIAILSGVFGSTLTNTSTTKIASEETAYERVMRTGTLRCGYAEWDSAVMRDPNTGAFHGSVVEVVNALAKSSDIKIE